MNAKIIPSVLYGGLALIASSLIIGVTLQQTAWAFVTVVLCGAWMITLGILSLIEVWSKP